MSGKATEIVGRFEGRAPFKAAVEDLLAAGFTSSDLSVLDTRESLSASGSAGQAWEETLTGLVGEIHYIGPLTAAGLIALATGPVGVAVAGGVAAGLTGAAISEFLSNIKATPHTEAFARALEAGAVMLWVRTESPEQEDRARGILTRHGARDIHRHQR